MNEYGKTLSFVGGAALLTVLAMVMRPGAVSNEMFNDEGEAFFPGFTGPEQVAELEVWQFDEAKTQLKPFNVKRDARNVWTIPSHFGYPADATTRMSKSAAMLLGLRKDAVVSDSKDDHAAFGVVDPKDEGLDARGRGMRVTFKDRAGTALADLIVGKEVEGKFDMRYVRVPDKKRVYKVKLDSQLSTTFADWIETDLLKTSSWDIAKITFDNYSVDEAQGIVVKGDKLVVLKDDTSKWTLQGLGADEATNDDRLREVGDALGQIKIVGVRPKPEGLTAALRQASGFDRMALLQAMQAKGYFLLNDGTLVSNEGDLIFETRKGVRYTLRFGEIAYGDGEAVTSGKEEPKPKEPAEGEQGPQPLPGNNRYLMVTAEFDAAILKQPAGPRLNAAELEHRRTARQRIETIVAAIETWRSQHDGKLPETLAQLTEKPAEGQAPLPSLEQDPWGRDFALQPQGDTYAVVSFGKDGVEGGEGADADLRSDSLFKEDDLQRTADEWKEYDRKVEEGGKEAGRLARRFGPWYYVIDAELFNKLKPQRKDLVKPKEADKPAEDHDGRDHDDRDHDK